MTRFICDLIPQMDVWSPDHQVDPLERIKRLDGEKGVSNNHTVASVAVKGNLRFPLDISYHGCPHLRRRASGGVNVRYQRCDAGAAVWMPSFDISFFTSIL
jgi:hypothetical protein